MSAWPQVVAETTDGPQTSTWTQVAAEPTDIGMALDSSTDHRYHHGIAIWVRKGLGLARDAAEHL